MNPSPTVVGQAYDQVAELYTELFMNELDKHPYDRAQLAAFVERVGQGASVLDVGCGPGAATDHLGQLGLAARGLDASQAMIDIAAEAFPTRDFVCGDMRSIDLPDSSLDGIVSRHSTIHFEPCDLAAVYAEFARVLRPGGTLLLWFFAVDDVSKHGKRYDHKVATAYRCFPDTISAELAANGLTEVDREIQPSTQNRLFELAAITAVRADH